MHCLVNYPLIHCVCDDFDGLIAQIIIGTQASGVSDLIVGFLCKIFKIVEIDIFFHTFRISLILSIDPQYSGEALLQKLTLLIKRDQGEDGWSVKGFPAVAGDDSHQYVYCDKTYPNFVEWDGQSWQ